MAHHIAADKLAAGNRINLCGSKFDVMSVRFDPIGNGTAKAPEPRYVARLEWSGEGSDPGPGYRTMTAGASVSAGSWCLAEQRLHA